MCGRFEGKKGKRIALLSAILFLLPVSNLQGQTLPLWLVSSIEQMVQGGEGNLEEMSDYFTELLQNPLDINNCTREQLEEIIFLEPLMVEAIIEYRQEFGPIFSVAELSLVDGFDQESAVRFAPFFTFGSSVQGSASYTRIKGRWNTRLRYKIPRVAPGYPKGAMPFTVASSLLLDLGKTTSVWFTLESDAGERNFPDFVSLGMSADNIPLVGNVLKIKKLVVGDYSLRMGQGVMLWNSFSISSGAEPSTILKRNPNVVLPYRSSGESGFYRGAALNLSISKWAEATLFYSSKFADAKVQGDYFYSLPSDGIHDTESAIMAKGALGQEHIGFDIRGNFSQLRVGLRGIWYHYDKKDGRKVYDYNKYQRFQGWWSAYGVDLLYSFRGVRTFAEIAIDRKGAAGGVAGVLMTLADGLDGALKFSYYDKKLNLPSGLKNQCGVSLHLKYQAFRNLLFSGYLSYIYSPYQRYRVNRDSHRLKAEANAEWKLAENHLLSVRATLSEDTGLEQEICHFRVQYDFGKNRGWGISARGQMSYCNGFGGLGFLEGWYLFEGSGFGIFARGTLFNIPQWNGRIYTYERDIQGVFSVPAYYGKGGSAYILLRYNPKKWVQANLRCSGEKYRDPSKDNIKLTLGISLLF